MKTRIKAIVMVLLAISTGPALAAPSEAELRKRFESRYPEIRELKQSGVVGETSEGYLDLVKSGDKDEKASDLLTEENADRKALYQLIAEKEKTEPEVVARRNAKRNFERARDGEYLKEEGKWTKKGEKK